MQDKIEFTLNNPLTQDDWNKLMDADIDKTASVTLVSQSGKEKKFIPMEDNTPDGLIQYLKDTFSHNDGVTVKGAYWDGIAVIKAD